MGLPIGKAVLSREIADYLGPVRHASKIGFEIGLLERPPED